MDYKESILEILKNNPLVEVHYQNLRYAVLFKSLDLFTFNDALEELSEAGVIKHNKHYGTYKLSKPFKGDISFEVTI